MNLHYNRDISYLFVNGIEIFILKADNKNVNFPTRFCLAHDGTKSVSLNDEPCMVRPTTIDLNPV